MSGTAGRWERIERLYHETLERDPAERAAFLDDACAGDPALRSEIESLLGFDTAASRFLTQSALEQVATRLPEAKAGALVGRQIHGYQIRELLGAGGMGEVYRATDLRLGRDVALKILHRAARTDPGYVQRFEAEARSASVLNHPNIVTIYGVGEDNDVRYIAMECVSGRTLGRVISEGKLGIAAALDLAVQLGDALTAAHDKGIIHRDLKPDNVMVTPEGRVKVLDFGIAKREGVVDTTEAGNPFGVQSGTNTEAGQILGTVGYMSPEQAEGRRATAASDLFSFGAILYELLSGRRAFARPTKQGTLDAIRHDQPEPFAISNATAHRPLRRVLERCLAKDPAQRYASARDLARELHDLRKRVEGRPLTRRQAIGLGIVATGAIATTSSLGWFLWSGGQRVHALALLPFENPAKDPALDHVCNGLTDALIFRIGVLPNIRVMPHSLVSNFKRTGRDERAFAQEIGADSYLTGSVTKAAGTLTIAASLHEVQTAKKLWFNSFTRADAQAIQESIATEIVYDGIRLQLSEDERRRLVARATDNAQAYELYLKAIAEQLQQTVEATIRQRELLDEVVTLDPKFARAYLQLGGTYSSAAIDGWEPPAECWPRVNEYIRKGLDRAPELPDGHVLTSVYEFFGNWRWESAADAWRLAMRAQGATMLPYNLVARALQEVALGRTGDAVNTMAHVRQLDPLTPLFMVKEAMFLRADGQLERAAAGYLTALRLDPGLRYGSFGLADVRVDQGRFDEAIDIYRQLEDGKNTDLTRILAAARGADGWLRVQRAVARLELGYCDIREKSGGYYIAPIDRAKFAALAGDSKLALRYLEEALDVRDPGVVMLKADRAWDSLRDHPAFQAAVKRVGLP